MRGAVAPCPSRPGLMVSALFLGECAGVRRACRRGYAPDKFPRRRPKSPLCTRRLQGRSPPRSLGRTDRGNPTCFTRNPLARGAILLAQVLESLGEFAGASGRAISTRVVSFALVFAYEDMLVVDAHFRLRVSIPWPVRPAGGWDFARKSTVLPAGQRKKSPWRGVCINAVTTRPTRHPMNTTWRSQIQKAGFPGARRALVLTPHVRREHRGFRGSCCVRG